MRWKEEDGDPTCDYKIETQTVIMTSGNDQSISFSPPFITAPKFIGGGCTDGTSTKNVTAKSITTSGATIATLYDGTGEPEFEVTFAGE